METDNVNWHTAQHTIAVVYFSTNHDKQQRMSVQFLFYQENDARACDKYSDNEPPCGKRPDRQRHCDDESVHGNSGRVIG